MERGKAGDHELVVTGFDRTHRLTKAVKTRSFVRMTDAAIARQIAGEYGLDADVASGGPSHSYVLQAGQTDSEFLQERAARLGYDVWVSGKTLHFAPRPRAAGDPPTVKYGSDGSLRTFRVRFSATDRCDQVIVRGYDSAGQKSLTGRSEEVDRGCTAPAAMRMADAARKVFGSVVRETGRRGISTQAEADAWAASLMARASGSEVLLEGEAAGDPRLTAGAEVRIEGVGTQLTGTYRLTSVQHEFTAGSPYLTRFVSGGKDPVEPVDLLTPAANLTAGGLGGGSGGAGGTGLVIGTVSSNNDTEQHLGRVKVTFPTLGGKDDSAWAEVISAGAGASGGVQWLPEKGDQVLVGFKDGDVHHPVVLGGMWSVTSPPPVREATDGSKTKTRLLITGKKHRLELTDDPDCQVVLALGDSECVLTLKKDASSLTGEAQLRISAKKVEVEGEELLSLTGKAIMIKGQVVTVGSDGVLTLSGKPVALNPPG